MNGNEIMPKTCNDAPRKDTSSEDWRDACASMGDMLRHSYTSSLFTDCTFSVAGKEFKCHANILAMNSPVFEAMLFGPMPRPEAPILIEDSRPDIFHQLLLFMYGDEGSITRMSSEDKIDLWILSDRFLMSRLFSLLGDDFHQNASNDFQQVLPVFQVSLLLRQEHIWKDCLEFITKHTARIITPNSCVDLTKEAFQVILEEDELNIKEPELFKCLHAWGLARVSAKSPHENTNIRSELEGLIEKIRFLNFHPKQFIELFFHANIFNRDEYLAIFVALVSSQKKNMPKKFALKRRISSRPRKRKAVLIEGILLRYEKKHCNANQPQSKSFRKY